jgi:hypothetical protein
MALLSSCTPSASSIESIVWIEEDEVAATSLFESRSNPGVALAVGRQRLRDEYRGIGEDPPQGNRDDVASPGTNYLSERIE